MCLPICRLLAPLHACISLGVLQTGGTTALVCLSMFIMNLGACSHHRPAWCAGEGLQSFTAVLDVVDQPHWLKSFILRFSVLVASKLDDQADPSVSRAITAQHSEAPSMAVPEQPSGGLVLSRSGSSMHTQEGPTIAHSTAAGLSKAAEQGWLPAKLLPQKSDSGGKQKQPKKRSKQKSKLDMHSTQPAEDDQPSKNSNTELFRSKPAHAEEPKWELQHAECLEEPVNGKAFSDDSAEDHTCRMEGSFPESASHSEPNGHAAQSPHAKHRDVGSAAGEQVQLHCMLSCTV